MRATSDSRGRRERTFVVRQDGGFYRTGTELFFRDPREPLPAGSRIDLRDVTVTVTHITDDGVPDEASFELTEDLEAGYVFREWTGQALVPFELPAAGGSVNFPGRMPALLDPGEPGPEGKARMPAYGVTSTRTSSKSIVYAAPSCA